MRELIWEAGGVIIVISFFTFNSFHFFSLAWLRQQSSWNQNSSVVHRRLWHQLSLHLLHGFLSNFYSYCFPWAICPDFFYFGGFCFVLIFLQIFFVFVNMGPNGIKNSKAYSYKSQPKVSKLILNFPLNGLHKTTFGIFEILSFRLLTTFLWSLYCV